MEFDTALDDDEAEACATDLADIDGAVEGLENAGLIGLGNSDPVVGDSEDGMGSLAVTGDLAPEADATGQNLRLRDAAGRAVISYARPKVWDASGTELPATMQTGTGCVILSVNEAAARYPLTIDPTFTQQGYLKAGNSEGSPHPGDGPDDFGWSVAVSDDTVVVGAPFEDSDASGVNGDDRNNSALDAGAAYAFEGVAADVAVEQPLGTAIANGGSQDFVAIGNSFPSLTFILSNRGNQILTGLTTTTDGPDAAMFTVTADPRPPLAPGTNTTFTVRFAPTSPGAKTAVLHIPSNDPDENPFDITLQGFTLTFTQDTDGDGVSDASEFQMSNFGFDWKVSQPALVANLLSQVQALKVDAPLISKDPATGLIKLTIGVQKSGDLIQFNPFPMTAPQTTINAQGELEFQFSAPVDAEFFRLEAR